jgi:hypothetical protein
MNTSHCHRSTSRAAATLAFSLLLLPAGAAHADAVLTWNEHAAKAATAACLHISGNGLVESRMYAMTHAAVHDAINAIDRRSRPYAFDAVAPGAASIEAAVATAAHHVLVSVIATLPESAECRSSGIAYVEAAYATALSAVAAGTSKDDGVAAGDAAAGAIIALRSADGSDQPMLDFAYPQGTAPGEWRFTPDFPFPIAFAPNWGAVTPFVLKRGAQFRPQAPYDVRSRKYAADYDEILQLGGDDDVTASRRTADQTEAGLFWLESSPLAWNRLARALAAGRGLDVWENARLFGLLNLAMADGYVASWDTKYHYNFWRPITAVRLGDTDGNPATAGVANWTPLQFTYPMPDHDSAHAVQGGVAAEVLARVLGTDDIAFTACSTTVGAGRSCTDSSPTLRVYSSLSQAAEENAASRVYVGIHFRHAVEEGLQHGRKIGAYAVSRALKRVP